MKATGIAGRGDLVRALAADRPDLLAVTAHLLGYTYVPRRKRQRKPDLKLPPLPPTSPSPPIDDTIERKPLADVPYWIPTEFEALQDLAEPAEQAVHPEDKVVWSTRPAPPEKESLALWSEVSARLRQALAEPVDTDHIDVDGVVACLSRGEMIGRLPRLRRRQWGRRLMIIDDRSRRLAPFWSDQDEVSSRIRTFYPHGAVERARSWGASSQPRVISAPSPGRDLPIEPGTRVLLLGDLGCLSDDPAPLHTYWEDIGRRLAAAGCRTITLNPSPRDRWIGARTRHWQQVVWERSVASIAIDAEARTLRARSLLRLVAPAVRIEAGLLRAARRLLSPDDADAGTEVDAWNDTAVASQTGLTTILQESELRTLRQEFADETKVSSLVRWRLLQRLRAWRAAIPQGVWFEEVLSLEERFRELLPAVDRAEAARFFAQIANCAGDDRTGSDGRAWFRRIERRLPDYAWLDPTVRPALNRLWAAADQADNLGTPPPAGFRASDVASGSSPCRVYLSQQGDALRATIQPPTVAPMFSPLSFLKSRNRLVTLDEAIADDSFWRSGAPPPWAREWDTDEYGPWVTFAVPAPDGTEVIQQLRWIPAGTFFMGSPKDEPERDEDEGPRHKVTISRGFWLAETACTQALWRAVMGRNPSRFQTDDQPVGTVSWNDAQSFLTKLNDQVPGLELRLPTEAEWEYACRAGTTTPFSFGENITPEQVNYNGNLPYPGGKTGLYRQRTVPVASLPANPWGLYEMHGNVWEWCADSWHDNYKGAPLDGSVWEDSSDARRVLRGGSWSNDARYVRSAFRNRIVPGDRRDYFGFRCARVQDGAEPGGAEQGRAEAGWSGASRQAERRTATDRLAGALAGETLLLRLDAERSEASETLPSAPSIIIRSDCESLTLKRMTCPEWASVLGRDRFGLWAEFEIEQAAPELAQQPVVQRLRWIPPGRFRMGSPETEPGRYDDEGPQHLVTIGRGFWLAETPCTQALWQAVMGDNPSRFKSSDRPVEQVSWTDVQAFLVGVNERIPGLDLVLPSEAQWEYACRAGSETAIYTGELPILGECNAPALDPIAWYGGNSGVNFDLEDGHDSSDWPEKQYPHERAGTRLVKQKAPNVWGLYDMLGNDWEWCADSWHDNYEGAPLDGSVWEDSSDAGRVLRGGSWSNVARYVRSAVRFRHVPGDRYDRIGFRCARVQP